MPAGLLSTTPDLQAICTKVLGHANAGDNLSAALAAAAYYPYRWDSVSYGYSGQAKFGRYGEPTLSVSSEAYTWEYNSTSTISFQVFTNKSTWIIGSESSYSLFTVTVWDSSNTTQITSGIYTSGMYIRVTPNATNGGSTNKYCYIFIATFNDYYVMGSSFTGCQKYAGAGVPPVVIVGSDGSMTLSSITTVLAIGSNQLYVYCTMNNITPTPPQTVYVNVNKYGPVWLGGINWTGINNGTSRGSWITIGEAAVEGRYYYVTLSTNNA